LACKKSQNEGFFKIVIQDFQKSVKSSKASKFLNLVICKPYLARLDVSRPLSKDFFNRIIKIVCCRSKEISYTTHILMFLCRLVFFTGLVIYLRIFPVNEFSLLDQLLIFETDYIFIKFITYKPSKLPIPEIQLF